LYTYKNQTAGRHWQHDLLNRVLAIIGRKWAVLLCLILVSCGHRDPQEVNEIRIPNGGVGIGFLPLMAMQKFSLIEKHATTSGLNIRMRWINVGGPAAEMDAIFKGTADFIAAGPPAAITVWDKTLGSSKIKGMAAICSVPVYLNTRTEHLKTLNDIRVDDRIAVTAAKISIPAIIMQMYAAERYGISDAPHFDPFVLSMSNAEGALALLSPANAVNAHFSSPPYHQRERRQLSVRTILSSDEIMRGPATFTMLITSSAFRQRNPRIYAAVMAALQEAIQMVSSDQRLAAKLLLDSMNGGGFTVSELEQILKDPAIRFTTTPELVMKYADFMHQTGLITNQPTSWKDLFFPEIHDVSGS
jgi:NitT/TauT family transport system substrate-binding protein